jgi:putative ABC transport system permease protein
MRLTQWLDGLRTDVRFAVRQLRGAPGFTAVAALTLALGIGANSAMFALADATLLRPLPFPDPERLVLVEERSANHQGALRSRIAPLNVLDWSEQNRTFEMMAAVYVPPGGGGPAMTVGDGTPEIVPNQTVTARFFDVFQVKPILGRTFQPADEIENAAVVVLSEAFWRARLGADPSIVGRAITFDGQARTVVGIVPESFQFLRPSVVWTLYPRDQQRRRLFAGLRVVGRIKPEVTLDAARSDLNAIADRLAQQFGDTREQRRVTVEPLRGELIGRDLRWMSMFFLGIVGFVLLMCCANIANLLLARATARTRELAVRGALGAGRGRIVRMLVTESLVLAALGGILGAAIGAAILAVAPSMVPGDLLPGAVTLTFDARVLTFCAVAALAVGLLFGLAPSWQAIGQPLTSSIASSSRTSTGRGWRFRSGLAGAQTAIAVLLLCAAGLLLRTVLVLSDFEPGYRVSSDDILTMDITMTRGSGGSTRRTPESQLSFYDSVEREISAVAGVRSVAWATTLPMGNSQTGAKAFEIVGEPPVREIDRPRANYQIVSPAYFATVDLPIVAGRAFTDRDTTTSTPVCIVSEAFVRRYLPGRNPVGVRIAIDHFALPTIDEREIVGVARQVKGRADETEDFAQIYVPNDQDVWVEAYLLVRTAGSVATLTPAIRAAIARVDKGLPVRRVMTLEQAVRQTTELYRFRAALLSTFAGLALVLAMVGVFGVFAYSVQQRTREFGVRIALGATTGHVLGLVLGSAARVIAAGVILGLGAALILAETVSAFLFGVQPRDPVTFASVAMVLLVTAAVACAMPALRATRVDPVVAFRNE